MQGEAAVEGSCRSCRGSADIKKRRRGKRRAVDDEGRRWRRRRRRVVSLLSLLISAVRTFRAQIEKMQMAAVHSVTRKRMSRSNV